MQIAGSVAVSIIVWSQYITLKPFWRTLFEKWRHQGVSVSYLSRSILQKVCNFSVLKLVISISTNFYNDQSTHLGPIST